MSYSTAILKRESDPKKVNEIVFATILSSIYEEDRTNSEKTFVLVGHLLAHTDNYGFERYFFDGKISEAYNILNALLEIGDLFGASILKNAIQTIHLPNPIPTNYIFAPTDKELKALKELDVQFEKNFENIESLLYQYIITNIEEFGV